MISVRKIEPSEWPTYRGIRLRALQDSPNAFGGTYELELARPDHLWASGLSDANASGKDAPLFALDGEKICGLAWCKLDASEQDVANLFQMWVAPESRGRGAGRELMNAAISWARGAGARRVRLGVTVGDSPASRLYSTLGFVTLGGLEPLREGSSLMSATMELNLGAA